MLEDHDRDVEYVLQKLRKNRLFIETGKCDMYSTDMDCLGHRIDDHGLHADANKMARICEWQMPRNLKEVQRFLGLVAYLAHFMPDVMAYTGPLSATCRNGQLFYWKPLHKTCFNHIKAIACKSLILKPIDPDLADPIWVICDTSMSGVGTMYSQGDTWQNCHPASFTSKKFTAAQMNYRVFEMETIAILEALLKWEDKLLGRRLVMVTDHKALEFFKTQRCLNSRQVWWMEFLTHFDYDITYIKGKTNLVADVLSRYYENDEWDESPDVSLYVNADSWLDPEGKDLPWARFEENHAMRATEELPHISSRPQHQRHAPRRADEPISYAIKHPVIEAMEARQHEAEELVVHKEREPMVGEQPPTNDHIDLTVGESMGHFPDLHPQVEGDHSILSDIRCGYVKDPLLAKVLANIEHHQNFKVINDLLYTRNQPDVSVLCIPPVVQNKQQLTEIIIAQVHEILGHLGPQKMADYVQRHYWWSRIGQDIEQYCKMCPICQMTKSSTQKVPGLLHSLPIPTQPWGLIAMDFVGPFPESRGHDYLWVVICHLTSMVHLVPIRTTTMASELAWLYVHKIVHLHRLAETIISNRDSKFTSRFWHEMHKVLGTKLLMSTLFHLQTDSTSERAICSVVQILCAMVRPDQRDWSEKILMVEFALNSAISNSSGFTPFELNYGYTPNLNPGIAPEPSSMPSVKQFVACALQNLADVHDVIIESRVGQTHHANRRHHKENAFTVGDSIFVSTLDLSLPKGHAMKLLLKYVSPFKILEAHPNTSTYKVELPTQLKAQNLHDRFHQSKLCPYHANDDALFPHWEAHMFYDFGAPDDQEWLVDKILAHQWDRAQLSFQVCWNQGDTTWETLETCKDLQVLDEYLQLIGVAQPSDLPRRTDFP